MKKIIKIVYCDLSKNMITPYDSPYQRTACEFLLGSNYCKCLFTYLYKSGLPCVITNEYVWDSLVWHIIYLDYKNSLKC